LLKKVNILFTHIYLIKKKNSKFVSIKSFIYVCHVFICRLHPFPSGLLIGLICCSTKKKKEWLIVLSFLFINTCFGNIVGSLYIYAWLYSSSYCHDHLKTKRNPIGTHWHTGFFFFSFNMITSANKKIIEPIKMHILIKFL
jgi:hypothetical protein